MTKHTKGPWEVNDHGIYDHGKKDYMVLISGLNWPSMMSPEDRRLIESAPQLLQACKMLLACGMVAKFPKDDGKTFLEVKMYADKAIKKAEGNQCAIKKI